MLSLSNDGGADTCTSFSELNLLVHPFRGQDALEALWGWCLIPDLNTAARVTRIYTGPTRWRNVWW